MTFLHVRIKQCGREEDRWGLQHHHLPAVEPGNPSFLIYAVLVKWESAEFLGGLS
jgi:hypothetical protein